MTRPFRSGFAATILLLVVALLALFDGTWRRGEIFSPSDVLESFYPWAANGPRREPLNVTRSDEAFYHQPLMVTHWARLNAFDLPEWNPYVLGGTPAFHQGLDVGRAFSPLSLPFYVAEPALAVTLYGPLRILVAGLLMWMYLRAAQYRPAACAFGAVSFAFNGAFLVWLSAPMPTVALWLPLLLLAAERVRTSGRWRDAALLALALGLQFLGAYLPTTLVLLFVVGFWSLGHLVASPASSVSSNRAVRLMAAGAVGGLALGACALAPMLQTLLASPAATRTMEFTLPWTNLATFAMPGFWGYPGAWWYPGPGNYPELVTYLGIPVIGLAGAGAWFGGRARERRVVLAVLVSVIALSQMYGWSPLSWISSLPGLRQLNPPRWNVALAFAVALLAARGVQQLSHLHEKEGRRLLMAVAAVLGCLGLVAAVSLWSQLEALQRSGSGAHERAQVVRFLVLAGFTVAALALTTMWRRAAVVSSWLLAAVAAGDLVQAAYGFNPTLPPERVYPSTPGLAYLQANVADGRIVPAGPSSKVPQSHIWGLYGLPTLTGFDFSADALYQAFLARATGQAGSHVRWDYVGIDSDRGLDLRLLGILGATLIVTPPTDVEPPPGAFTTLEPITEGRRIEQCFVIRQSGFRRLDLLPATYSRANEGWWDITLSPADGRATGRQWRIEAARLRDLDWLRLVFPPDHESAGRRYCIAVSGHSPASRSATLMASSNGLEGGSLSVDGRPDGRALYFRTFSIAADRIPGAPLVYAGDVNVYRNPMAMPLAWFVGETQSVPAEEQVAAVSRPELDPRVAAVVEPALPPVAAASAARVIEAIREGDRRLFQVSAPHGGVLVIGERFDPHWRLEADGHALLLVRANAVLMAASIPPGTRRLTLRYERRDWMAAIGLSALTLLAVVAVLLVSPGTRRRAG